MYLIPWASFASAQHGPPRIWLSPRCSTLNCDGRLKLLQSPRAALAVVEHRKQLDVLGGFIIARSPEGWNNVQKSLFVHNSVCSQC